MPEDQFLQIITQSGAGGGLLICVYLFGRSVMKGFGRSVDTINTTLTGLKTSIETLNSDIKVIIEKTAWHERAIDAHESRLSTLEKKGN